MKEVVTVYAVYSLFSVVFTFSLIITWVINLIQLLNCDFESPWRDEIIHAIGLIPVASLFTVWF